MKALALAQTALKKRTKLLVTTTSIDLLLSEDEKYILENKKTSNGTQKNF
jgi:hypothetical protein